MKKILTDQQIHEKISDYYKKQFNGIIEIRETLPEEREENFSIVRIWSESVSAPYALFKKVFIAATWQHGIQTCEHWNYISTPIGFSFSKEDLYKLIPDDYVELIPGEWGPDLIKTSLWHGVYRRRDGREKYGLPINVIKDGKPMKMRCVNGELIPWDGKPIIAKINVEESKRIDKEEEDQEEILEL